MKKKKFILTLLIFCLLFLSLFLTEVWSAATYSTVTGDLDIPCVNIPDGGAFEVHFAVSGAQLDLAPGREFVLQDAVPTELICETPATVDVGTGVLHIPVLAVPDTGVGMQYYDVMLLYVNLSDPISFSVTDVTPTQLGVIEPGPAGPQGPAGSPGPAGPQGPQGEPGDENGLDYTNRSEFGTSVNLSNSWTTIRSITVTAPASGYVTCIGSGYVDWDVVNPTGTVFVGWASSSGGTPLTYTLAGLVAGDNFTYIPLTSLYTFSVGSGSKSFYLRGKTVSAGSGDFDFLLNSVACMYFPNKL